MSGGGSGGSGTQKYEWNDQMAPQWADALSYAKSLKDRPYQGYGYQRIAGLDQNQQDAMGIIRNTVASGGAPEAKAANAQAEDTLNDRYLWGAGANPTSQMRNQYEGMNNPYFRGQLQSGLEDMSNAYKQGTSADTTRMFNMAGAFGGSAHQNAVANNENAFAKQAGNYVQGMQNEQYNRSGAMDEARMGRIGTAYEGERGRQMSAIAPGQNANNMAFQGAQQLMGAGDVNRSLNQDYLNQAYNDWQTGQQYPYTQLDYWTGILGRAQGGVSPNVTTQQSGYSASPYSQLLGAGLLGYGMTR